MLRHVAPARAEELAVKAQKQVKRRFAFYERLAGKPPSNGNGGTPVAPAPAAPALPATRTAPAATTPPPAQS